METKTLQQKIDELKVQHHIDEFFDMKPFTFWSGIELMPEKRNHAPYRPAYGYGTYEEQQERLQIINDDLFNALMDG